MMMVEWKTTTFKLDLWPCVVLTGVRRLVFASEIAIAKCVSLVAAPNVMRCLLKRMVWGQNGDLLVCLNLFSTFQHFPLTATVPRALAHYHINHLVKLCQFTLEMPYIFFFEIKRQNVMQCIVICKYKG